MHLQRPTAEVYVPDGSELGVALSRTTYLGIGAHPDDLELMAADGILRAVASEQRWFCGVIVTDGARSPRGGRYAKYDEAQMRRLRRAEQKAAARLGHYSAVILLDYPSEALVSGARQQAVADLRQVVDATRPSWIYTHNLADAHHTHVCVALDVITACRAANHNPERLIGCEVWRDLDWLAATDRVVMPVSGNEKLQVDLIRAFASQVESGKPYDRAALGRRHAHATFGDSRTFDAETGAILGMDLTPLLDPSADPQRYVQGLLDSFSRDVLQGLKRAVSGN